MTISEGISSVLGEEFCSLRAWENSLDKPLYSLVFPNVSVIAKGNCRDVEHAVLSIRNANELHWLDVFGLVDNDRRPPHEIDRIRECGVYATSVDSVEGVYYHPNIQRRVAERQANITGADFNKCVEDASTAALQAITAHAQRLSERVSEKLICEEFFSHIPNRDRITLGTPVNVFIDVPKIVAEERALLQKALDAGDLMESWPQGVVYHAESAMGAYPTSGAMHKLVERGPTTFGGACQERGQIRARQARSPCGRITTGRGGVRAENGLFVGRRRGPQARSTGLAEGREAKAWRLRTSDSRESTHHNRPGSRRRVRNF